MKTTLSKRLGLAAASLAALTSMAGPARAEGDDLVAGARLRALEARPAADRVEAPEEPPQPPARPTEIAAGARVMVVSSTGLDPYSSGDVLAQASVGFAQTVVKLDRFSLLGVAEYDFGMAGASVRGNESSLAVHRMALGLESRLRVASRLYLFAKAAPSVLALRGSITTGAAEPLVARPWTWGLDTTGGGGLRLGGIATSLWLVGEVGYAFGGEAPMRYAPAADASDPQRYGTVMLPTLRLAGPVSRLALAIAF